MTSLSQLRRAAVALPEVEEGTHLGLLAFSVHGKGFASVTADGLVQLRLPDANVDAAATAHPSGERMRRGDRLIGFRAPLADIDGQALNALVRAAWFHRAPKRLAAALIAAEDGTDRPGDLPAGIGQPAIRALRGAGVSTLEQVATRTQAELLALHGVGPKAVRILAETLAERGMPLR